MAIEDRSTLRLIDANANRAAEGLRTIEDCARLVWEDATVAGWMKELRHSLQTALSKLGREARLLSRSTETDAGTDLAGANESARSNIDSLVPAAAERVTQALRCLEEGCKVIDSALGEELKQLRYRAYDKLAEAELRLARKSFPRNAALYLLIDCSRPLGEFVKLVEELSGCGVDVFQLRDKQAEASTLLQYGREAMSVLSNSSSALIINDRVDIALACDADGVHVGQDDLPLENARKVAGNDLWIGVSTHDINQAARAEQGGADYIGCGPTFPSNTKQFDEFAGTAFLQQVSERIQIPYFAIGGINPKNLAQVQNTGCGRVAVSGAILDSDSPLGTASQLAGQLQDFGDVPTRAE